MCTKHYSSLQLTYTFKTRTKHTKTAKARTLCVYYLMIALPDSDFVGRGQTMLLNLKMRENVSRDSNAQENCERIYREKPN